MKAEELETLHLWVQIVGKIRTKLHPFINHWWHSALYVTPRGLTTGSIPHRERSFEIRFDFVDHVLEIETNDGERRAMALAPKSVAMFYAEVMDLMNSLNLPVLISTRPQEIPNPIPFDLDDVHAKYNRKRVEDFFTSLREADRILKVFRSGFTGKCSPVHFFWGSFDLAFSVFSGRKAPERIGADRVTREGYSDELMSWGFWAGSGNIQAPAYYSYAAPEPQDFSRGPVRPSQAFYNPPTKGYILMLDEVLKSRDPEGTVLEFCESTYILGAKLGEWENVGLRRAA